MAKLVNINLSCPNCNQPVSAELKKNRYKFLLYVCPKCHNNVVYYDNKTDIISDTMVKNLRKNKKLTVCGNTCLTGQRKKRREITDEDLLNLKILLATENDSGKIIERL